MNIFPICHSDQSKALQLNTFISEFSFVAHSNYNETKHSNLYKSLLLLFFCCAIMRHNCPYYKQQLILTVPRFDHLYENDS